MSEILVIGSGATGLCAGYFLISRGHKVKIVDSQAYDPTFSQGLKRQIHRPFYWEQPGLDLRASSAFCCWNEIFEKLRGQYFSPRGVLSVSKSPNDWTDSCMKSLMQRKQFFRYLTQESLEKLMSGFDMSDARFGILTERGGEFHASTLLFDLREYLKDNDVEFFYGSSAQRIGSSKVKLQDGQILEADFVLVTGGQNALMPDRFENVESYRSYYAILEPDSLALKMRWYFTPCWIDLGGDQHLWGAPSQVKEDVIKIGAGCLTHKLDENAPDPREKKSELIDIYAQEIRDFDKYKIQSLEASDYQSYANGQFSLKKDEQFVGIMGDCGHGFKFAAENAKIMCESIETGNYRLAARKLRGEFGAHHLS